MNRLQEIQQKIDFASNAYYNGTPIMDDSVFDRLIDELKILNPLDSRLSRVGFNVRDSILSKVKHAIPMGSQDKCVNATQFAVWVANNLIKKGVSTSEKFFASYKMDGMSVSLTYKNGNLVDAITRGDGIEGESIFANALLFKGIPKTKLQNFTGFVRGELVLTLNDWKEVDANLKSNPRNAVNLVRRKSGEHSEFVTFYGFKLYDENGIPVGKTEVEAFSVLKSYGFNVVESFVGSVQEVWDWYEKTAKIRSSLNFWIDGIIACVNSIKIQEKLGVSNNKPNSSIAIKFDAECAVSVLESVDFQVGNSGVICPVGNFTPVRLGGATITCASLYNFNNINTLDLHINDEIEIIKCNDIIPAVTQVLKKAINRKAIEVPTNCPCCGDVLGTKVNVSGEDSTAIYCINDACPAIVTGKIERYLKSLDIQGIGISVIEALVKNLGVKTPADLYLLDTKEAQIADMELSGKTRMGEKRATKIIEAINNKRELTLSEFLGSLSIFGLGKRRVKIIQENTYGKMDTLEAWLDGSLAKYAIEAGVPNIADRISKELQDNKNLVYDFLTNGIIIKLNTPKIVNKNAFIFCITGKLSRGKSEYQKLIEDAGHIYTDTFSKDLTYLVAADPNSGSSKMVKAIKNGTKVIGEDELFKLL